MDCTSITVGLIIHGSLFKDTHFVAKDLLKLDNAINTYLINLNITLYPAFLVNIYEYLKYHHNQYYHNQPQNHIHIHIVLSFS